MNSRTGHVEPCPCDACRVDHEAYVRFHELDAWRPAVQIETPEQALERLRAAYIQFCQDGAYLAETEDGAGLLDASAACRAVISEARSLGFTWQDLVTEPRD